MMMRWWQERTPREQALLSGLGLLLAVLAVWQLVLSPLAQWREAAAQSYLQADELLEQVRRGAAEAQALQAVAVRRETARGGSLRSTVTATARQAGITISRLEPSDDGGLTIWLEEADAQEMQAWLAGLYRDHGIAVGRATVRRHDSREAVRAQISFEGGGAS